MNLTTLFCSEVQLTICREKKQNYKITKLQNYNITELHFGISIYHNFTLLEDIKNAIPQSFRALKQKESEVVTEARSVDNEEITNISADECGNAEDLIGR